MAKLSDLKISGGVTILPDASVLSGTYNNDVIVQGNASIGAAIVINGFLKVEGNLTMTGGFQVDTVDDLIVDGICDFTHASTISPINIGGDFKVLGEEVTGGVNGFNISSSSNVGGGFMELTTGGEDFTDDGIVIGVTTIEMTSGPVSGEVFTITGIPITDTIEIDNSDNDFPTFVFDGSDYEISNISAKTFEMPPKSNSSILSIIGDFVCGGLVNGKSETINTPGLSIVIGGNLYGKDLTLNGQINLGGGKNSKGGDLTVSGVMFDASIFSLGGDSNLIADSSGGGGSLTIGGFNTTHDVGASLSIPVYTKEIDLRSGLNLTGSTGSDSGDGGAIVCSGDINCLKINTSASINVNTGVSGNGGSINVSGDLLVNSTITSSGATISNGTSGANSDGGSGGDILVGGNLVLLSGTLLSDGGGSRGTGDGGRGGNVYCSYLACGSSIFIRGGGAIRNGTTNVCGRGGAGGSLLVSGDAKISSNCVATGGNADGLSISTELGGQGGNLSIHGNLTCLGLTTDGGNSVRTTGRSGGSISVKGFTAIANNINNSGGDAQVSGNAGAAGNVFLDTGCTARSIVMNDGTGAATTSSSTLNFGGPCVVEIITKPVRTNSHIKGRNQGASLSISTMTNSNPLLSSSTTNPTASVTDPKGKIYVYNNTTKVWHVHVGVLA